ncbi:hypothetical protein [Phenylobacterium soli]|uniref:Uncharacterized protein n=1 Tax=Phenylobacterium soli TaxID=2170551 RepID=A0A328ASX1_9CAUL|nr:hypothetical protein [Phenylobacterium soli]RAK56028.1 hypothetical protein DJ017_16680 [Phenylobacterium soli]
MAQTSDPRQRTWIAFLAGAVAMLAIVLLWLALSGAHGLMGEALRADVALPRGPALPNPDAPPPEGPHVPKLPLPTPR